jgi:drug/metabolite transporter (DMT)-like permease
MNPIASNAESEATAEARAAPATAPRRRHRSGLMLLLMLIATFCWATNIIAGKEALRGFGALALAQMRVLGASLTYIVLFLAWRRADYRETPCRLQQSLQTEIGTPSGRGSRVPIIPRPRRDGAAESSSGDRHRVFRWRSAPRRPSLPRSRHDWVFLGWVALFGITLNQLFFIGGLARTSAAHTALIVALGPVMVLALSCMLRMEALTLIKSVGILVSFCGVAVLTLGKGGGGNGAHWQGDLLAFAGSGVFAYFTILMKKAAVQSDTLTLNTIVFTLGSALMLPFTARQLLAVRWSAMPSLAWWSLAYMVILGSVLAYLLFAYALAELTPSRVAAFNYLQPLIAISLGVWMLGERITSGLIAGGALILVGLFLTEHERDTSPNYEE